MQAHDDKRAGRGVRTRQYNPQDKVVGHEGWKQLMASKLAQKYDGLRKSGMSHDEAVTETLRSTTAGPGSIALFKTLVRKNPKADPQTGLHIEYSPANMAYFVMWHGTILNVVNSKAEAREIVKDLTRKRNPGATNLAQYVQAAVEHARGAHDSGGLVIHETPKAKRREFAREIAFRKGYRNPRGRVEGELEVLDKSPHTEVDYEPHSKHPSDKCANCRGFIPGTVPRCKTVKNPISPGGWCERHDPIGANPAAQVMSEWRAGKLRTSAGVLVPKGSRGDKMARAILLSELRREGKIGPRQNPEGSADELYRRFHGAAPDNHLAYDVPLIDPYGLHPEIGQLGLLVRLIIGEGVRVEASRDGEKIEPIEQDWWHCDLVFVPSLADYHRMERALRTQTDIDQLKSWLRKNGTPDVAGAPTPPGTRSKLSNQLYIVGGNQNIDSQLPQIGADPEKEVIDCGFAYLIEYFTQKRFDQMDPIDYYHSFAEKHGSPPRLLYWRKAHLLQLAGGDYTVTSRGIEN